MEVEKSKNPSSSDILSCVIRLEDIINSIPGDKWVDKLRSAYVETSGRIDNDISLEKWINSRLKYLLDSEKLSEIQMKEYFMQIDSNCDNLINWNELIDYISCHQKSITSGQSQKQINLIHHAPNSQILKKAKRGPPCLKLIYLTYIGEIITLTESNLTFWNIENCSITHQFSDIDFFVDFCFI